MSSATDTDPERLTVLRQTSAPVIARVDLSLRQTLVPAALEGPFLLYLSASDLTEASRRVYQP